MSGPGRVHPRGLRRSPRRGPDEPRLALHRGRREQHQPGSSAAEAPPSHRVARGNDGCDGVQAAIDKHPGLILLDNRLPDATGVEILRQLASATATAAIPVVAFSSDSGDIIDELLASGAAEFVGKPFDIHQFVAIIDRYLR